MRCPVRIVEYAQAFVIPNLLEKSIDVELAVSGVERRHPHALRPPSQTQVAHAAIARDVFLGRGGCISCHGAEGKGDGAGAKNLPIQPRNFTNPKFNKYRTPGEMMWVLKNGSMGQTGRVPGTGMLPVVQPNGFISEADGWKVLLYERSLGEKK